MAIRWQMAIMCFTTTADKAAWDLQRHQAQRRDMKDSVMDLFYIMQIRQAIIVTAAVTVTDLPVSKVSPSKCFKITVTVADDQCYYILYLWQRGFDYKLIVLLSVGT